MAGVGRGLVTGHGGSRSELQDFESSCADVFVSGASVAATELNVTAKEFRSERPRVDGFRPDPPAVMPKFFNWPIKRYPYCPPLPPGPEPRGATNAGIVDEGNEDSTEGAEVAARAAATASFAAATAESESDYESCSEGGESSAAGADAAARAAVVASAAAVAAEVAASSALQEHQAGHSATGLPCIIVRDYSNGSPVDQEFESFMVAVRAFQSLKLKCRRAELVMNGVVKESFG